ncbi:MAG: aspartyl-tRNA amidotransferase [Deltaproteobacteria bacterium CG_4_10_14_0_2_um_filter_43_8]|nr:MAG: aspartyl-tRNA amidotransferase [Deltaproteobacteria bacterium CG11_big_fil_rev_8_21_14_0_20_42_23]PJA19920.1 MAG: aspartyl-tRNA amidotransferase [Deltaproteobacteria bacterium CG_4_10_14_0_2_um_filter_43_8]PJC64892.1 MAG: aspartyl-tRNA amidotransferase [Deltaproteobacteria bacterium CG_4_9_14_0_2_um_filter_42_21]
MSVNDQINADLKQAMKDKATEKLAVLRMLRAAIKNKEIDAKQTLDDVGILKLIAGMVKQRQDSIALFTQGGRQDLAEKEASEIVFLEGYLPSQLSDDELKKLVLESIQETGANGKADMGKVMKSVMPKLEGRADGRRVNDILKDLL